MVLVARKSGRKRESSALSGFQHEIRLEVLLGGTVMSKTAREV